MGTKLNEAAYQELIDANKKCVNLYMPLESLEAKHILQILDWSVKEIYQNNSNKVKVDKDLNVLVEPTSKEWEESVKNETDLIKNGVHDRQVEHQQAEEITKDELIERLRKRVIFLEEGNNAFKALAYDKRDKLKQSNDRIKELEGYTKHQANCLGGLSDSKRKCTCGLEKLLTQ